MTDKFLAALRVKARVLQGRDPEPSAGIIDSESMKGADSVGRDSRGYDAGKKVNGRKRFIVTDTLGLLVTVLAATWQDRDGPTPHSSAPSTIGRAIPARPITGT